MSNFKPMEYINRVKKIGDFISLRRGKTYKSQLLGKPGAVLIGLASIEREGGFRDDKLQTYGGDCPDSISLKPGDLYVSLKDITHDGHLLGAVSRIPKKIKLGRLTQDTVKLVFDKDDFPKDYIYWLLRTPQYRNYCRSRQTGTTNLGLSREDFLSFPVPPITEKTNAIIKSLEAIERKIDNLKQQNETLEKIAQTLFKHWFIDFEFPNDDGKPYKSSGGAMIASELGDIPEGWQVMKFGNLGELNRGRSRHRPRYAEHLYGGQYPFIQTGDIKSSEGFITDYEQTYSEAGLAQSRLWGSETLCITIAANIAETGILTFSACFPDSVIGFIANPNICDVYYIHRFFNFKRKEIENTAIGSVQKNLNLETIENIKFYLPPFEKYKKPILIFRQFGKRIQLNKEQIRTLTKTRDTLLPKLMSGEIRVKEA